MLLTPTAYFPPISHFALAIREGGWLWEGHENYQKGGWRNRCRIAGPNRVEMLSIPLVKGKHQSTPIQEVEISYVTDWIRHHQRSMATAYGRAPFYVHYSPVLFALLDQRPKTLWELNQKVQQNILKFLNINDLLAFTNFFKSSYPKGCLDLRSRHAKSPLTPQPYPQLFQDRHGFLPDLSILDLIFCLGPAAGSYLRKSAKK